MGTSCGCCVECCSCDRLIESVDINFNGVSYDISIDKTIREIKCFYPIYIGDAVSTWRYEKINNERKYIRSFFKSVEILIDYKDPAVVEPFIVLQCENVPSVYAMHDGKVYNKRYYRLFWGDERFLVSLLVLQYRDKIINLSIPTNSIEDSQIAESIQTQIRKFGVDNNFLDLVDCDILFNRVNLVPNSPILPNKTIESSLTFEQFQKTKHMGRRSDIEIFWHGSECPPFAAQTVVTGRAVVTGSLTYNTGAIPVTTLATGLYTYSILGFYITLTYNGSSLIIKTVMNYVDENENISEFIIRNNLEYGIVIPYVVYRSSCGSSVTARGNGGTCAGGGLDTNAGGVTF